MMDVLLNILDTLVREQIASDILTVTSRADCSRLAMRSNRGDPDGRSMVTGRVESDQSVLVRLFALLTSRERLSVRVRVWGQDGSVSEWSDSVSIEAGLLSTSDWSARFISPAWDEDTSRVNPSPYLRREFELRTGIKSARLYITSLGVSEALIMGQWLVIMYSPRMDGL
jgi:hypothetical protein